MGIGTAMSMAEKGASVILTGRDEPRGASTVEKIRADGHDADFIAADFSEMSEVGASPRDLRADEMVELELVGEVQAGDLTVAEVATSARWC
jgi:short-subunit dehydrogenase